ncbi:MAG: hypothetical protein WCT27_02735 [Patescibacteria group bacterium]|jgi:hypothetical protein
MPVEQIDMFLPSTEERDQVQQRIYEALTAANQRIDGAISQGHFEAMMASVLEHEAGIHLTDSVRMEIKISIEAAGGNRNKVDYQLLADKIAGSVEQPI